MKYIDYYPSVLKEIKEIQIIGECMDIETEELEGAREKVIKECFVSTAEDLGLERLEEIFNIAVSDKSDIELRRFNIIAKIMNKKSYLIDVLNSLIGENGYSLRYYEKEQRLDVVLTLERKDYMNAVKELVEDFVPVNILLNFSLAYNTHNVLSKYTHNELKIYRHNQLTDKEGL